MRMLIFALAAVLACSLRLDAATPAADPASDVSRMIRAALVQAPSAFAASRGKRLSVAGDEDEYAVAGSLRAACPPCKLADEYADEDSHERWVASFNYSLPKGWSQARAAEFIATAIGPIVRNYSLRTGADDDGRTYFDWKHGRTFVYAYSWSTKTGPILRVRIGQYLPKDIHVVKYSTPLTDAQKTQLDTDIKNLLAVSLSNAQQNFVTLRGKAYGSDVFDATVHFSMLGSCRVDGWAKTASISPKWILSCDTDAFVDGKNVLEPAIAHTIWMALPGSFREASAADRGSDDYRWDDASGAVSVMLNSQSYGKRTNYTISIYHFLGDQ
ncbi:MAG TPA: hypothetical protein VFN49_13470 [Candidatus Aquilonibacter sp.]|nr:hypothetical protein [Candidatus Aquilonibacter sp.]